MGICTNLANIINMAVIGSIYLYLYNTYNDRTYLYDSVNTKIIDLPSNIYMNILNTSYYVLAFNFIVILTLLIKKIIPRFIQILLISVISVIPIYISYKNIPTYNKMSSDVRVMWYNIDHLFLVLYDFYNIISPIAIYNTICFIFYIGVYFIK